MTSRRNEPYIRVERIDGSVIGLRLGCMGVRVEVGRVEVGRIGVGLGLGVGVGAGG